MFFLFISIENTNPVYDCGVLVTSIPGADIILYETTNSKQDVNKNVTVYYQSSVTVKKLTGGDKKKFHFKQTHCSRKHNATRSWNIKIINVVSVLNWASYQLGPVL